MRNGDCVQMLAVLNPGSLSPKDHTDQSSLRERRVELTNDTSDRLGYVRLYISRDRESHGWLRVTDVWCTVIEVRDRQSRRYAVLREGNTAT